MSDRPGGSVSTACQIQVFPIRTNMSAMAGAPGALALATSAVLPSAASAAIQPNPSRGWPPDPRRPSWAQPPSPRVNTKAARPGWVTRAVLPSLDSRIGVPKSRPTGSVGTSRIAWNTVSGGAPQAQARATIPTTTDPERSFLDMPMAMELIRFRRHVGYAATDTLAADDSYCTGVM